MSSFHVSVFHSPFSIGGGSQAAPFASIVIPFIEHHSDLVEHATQSALAQTVPVEVITVEDVDHAGAGASRNHGATFATAPFISFLDADDHLAPRFIEKCIDRWQVGRYVYSDWVQGVKLFTLPDNFPQPYEISLHLNTTLMTRYVFEQSGGYPDGELEDTAYYWHLMSRGICGIRVPEGLVHYSTKGQRSALAEKSENYHVQLMELKARYYDMACSNCGGTPVKQQQIAGQHQDGYVLVIANWGGNQRRKGKRTGNLYPYTGNGRRLWIDPADQQADPQSFVLVDPPLVDQLPGDFDEMKAHIQNLRG